MKGLGDLKDRTEDTGGPDVIGGNRLTSRSSIVCHSNVDVYMVDVVTLFEKLG